MPLNTPKPPTKKHRFLLLAVVLVLVAIALFQPKTAQALFLVDDALMALLNFILAVFSYLIGKLYVLIVTVFIALITIDFHQLPGFSDKVDYIWRLIRDLSNMFFIVVMLLIAIGSILKIENYRWNRLLPKLVLMAIAINFSKTIALIIIDASQVLMMTFVNAFKDIAVANLTRGFGMFKVGGGGLSQVAGGFGGYKVFAAILLNIATIIISTIVMATFAILLLARIVVLWILVALSPVAYIARILSSTERFSRMWWDNFIKLVILGPALGFFLWMSLIFIGSNPIKQEDIQSSLDKAKPESAQSGDEAGAEFLGTAASSPYSVINFGITIALMIFSVSAALKMGTVGSGAAGAVWKGGMKGAGILSLGATSGIGKVVGGLGGKMQSKWGDAGMGWGTSDKKGILGSVQRGLGKTGNLFASGKFIKGVGAGVRGASHVGYWAGTKEGREGVKESWGRVKAESKRLKQKEGQDKLENVFTDIATGRGLMQQAKIGLGLVNKQALADTKQKKGELIEQREKDPAKYAQKIRIEETEQDIDYRKNELQKAGFNEEDFKLNKEDLAAQREQVEKDKKEKEDRAAAAGIEANTTQEDSALKLISAGEKKLEDLEENDDYKKMKELEADKGRFSSDDYLNSEQARDYGRLKLNQEIEQKEADIEHIKNGGQLDQEQDDKTNAETEKLLDQQNKNFRSLNQALKDGKDGEKEVAELKRIREELRDLGGDELANDLAIDETLLNNLIAAEGKGVDAKKDILAQSLGVKDLTAEDTEERIGNTLQSKQQRFNAIKDYRTADTNLRRKYGEDDRNEIDKLRQKGPIKALADTMLAQKNIKTRIEILKEQKIAAKTSTEREDITKQIEKKEETLKKVNQQAKNSQDKYRDQLEVNGVRISFDDLLNSEEVSQVKDQDKDKYNFLYKKVKEKSHFEDSDGKLDQEKWNKYLKMQGFVDKQGRASDKVYKEYRESNEKEGGEKYIEKQKEIERIKEIRDNPLSPSDLEKLEEQIKSLEAEERRLVDKMISAQPESAYYARQNFLRNVNEERAKISDIHDSDELQAIARQGAKEGNQYKVVAAANQLADDGNFNDLLNDSYNLPSNLEGVNKYVNDVLIKQLGMNPQRAYSVQTDLGLKLFNANHFSMSYTTRMEGGRYRQASPEEQAKAALAMMLKKGDPRSQAHDFNRLAYGYEDPRDGGKFHFSPMGLGILAANSNEFAHWMDRAEMNKNAMMYFNYPYVQEQLKKIPKIWNAVATGNPSATFATGLRFAPTAGPEKQVEDALKLLMNNGKL